MMLFFESFNSPPFVKQKVTPKMIKQFRDPKKFEGFVVHSPEGFFDFEKITVYWEISIPDSNFAYSHSLPKPFCLFPVKFPFYMEATKAKGIITKLDIKLLTNFETSYKENNVLAQAEAYSPQQPEITRAPRETNFFDDTMNFVHFATINEEDDNDCDIISEDGDVEENDENEDDLLYIGTEEISENNVDTPASPTLETVLSEEL